jgi:hypothetical protein
MARPRSVSPIRQWTRGLRVLIPTRSLTGDRLALNQVLQSERRLEATRVVLAVPLTGLRRLERVDIDQLEPDPRMVSPSITWTRRSLCQRGKRERDKDRGGSGLMAGTGESRSALKRNVKAGS